jgi:predicted nucleotidyltransferase
MKWKQIGGKDKVILVDKEEIINFLRIHKEEMRLKFGVIRIGLFGSYARESEKEASDIDIVVEMDERHYRHHPHSLCIGTASGLDCLCGIDISFVIC